jgi:glycogen operon protein
MERQLRLYSRMPLGVSCCSSTARTTIRPARVIRLDPYKNRTYYYWHVFVPDATGQIYAYRVAGPFDPGNGLCFDRRRFSSIHYGRSVTVPKNYSRDAAGPQRQHRLRNEKHVSRSPCLQLGTRSPLCRLSSRTIIYEMHVAGFTRHRQFRVSENRNAALTPVSSKNSLSSQLGITAVELAAPYSSSTIRTAPKDW